jgi:hypothetical protein
MYIVSSTQQIQKANNWMTAGLGLSVAAGVAIAIFGRAALGGELWRWCALGVGVAGAGEAATLLARAFIRYRPAKPMRGVEEAIGKLPHFMPGIPIPQDTLDSYHELLAGRPSGEGTRITSLIAYVDDRIRGKSFSEINDLVVKLNKERLVLWSELSLAVRDSTDWDKREVQELYLKLVLKTAEMAEVIIRSLELRYPEAAEVQLRDGSSHMASREELIGRHIGGQDALGYFGIIGEMSNVHGIALHRKHCVNPTTGEWTRPKERHMLSDNSQRVFELFVKRVQPFVDQMFSKGTRSIDARYQALLVQMTI